MIEESTVTEVRATTMLRLAGVMDGNCFDAIGGMSAGEILTLGKKHFSSLMDPKERIVIVMCKKKNMKSLAGELAATAPAGGVVETTAYTMKDVLSHFS